MSLPKPLMFTVGLVDQITKPIAKITKQFNGLASNYQAGTMQMGMGIGGIAAAGIALQSALMPAIEMDRKLGDIKGLGVTNEALKAMTSTAYDFSLQYGRSVIDVLDHTEKIRAAMGKMPVHMMQSATTSSAILSMVMKSDADTVTKYFKTLNGNYQGQADAMGQGKFIEQITGMTAMAKQRFGTSMADMEGMIDGMHSLPSTLGVSMDEQFAVLGMLGKQMGQGDAVTQYTNYLEGIAGAQTKLGIKLTDSKGDLLPMIDVIKKIKPLIKDMSGLDARNFLDGAGLGDGALTIINMSKDLVGLKANIDSFKNIKGMGPAMDMAAAMTDQSERLSQSWYVIRAAFGSAVLPAFNQFVGWIADMGKEVLWFTQTFPNLTRVLGYGAIAILGLVAAGGAFTVMMGVSKMVMTTYGLAAMAWAGINTVLTSGMASLRTMMLAVNLAMYANPVGLVVAGVAALIGVVGLAVYYFDDLRAMMAGTAWGEPILFAVDAIANLLKILGGVAVSVFGTWFNILGTVFNVLKPFASFLLDVVVFNLKIMGGVWAAVFGTVAYVLGGLVNSITWVVTAISDGFTWAFDIVSAGWNELVSWFTNDAWLQYLFGKVANIGQYFSAMWDGIKGSFAETWGWIADKLNMLPGIDIDVTPVMDGLDKQHQIPDFMQSHNQQTVPMWMQQTAANQVANPAPMSGPWMNAPTVIQPESVTQQQHLQLVKPASFVPDGLKQSIDVQRNLPAPYQPEALTQQLDVKPMVNESISHVITPRMNQQAAMSAQANRAASQTNSKSLSFGDVIIKHPPKNFSFAELAEQQELMTG